MTVGRPACAPGSLSSVHVDDVASLPGDAQRLLERAERRSMQLGAAWFENYCRELGQAHGRPRFQLLRRGQHTIAVLPLAVHPGARRGHVIRALANYYSSLYAPALADDITVDELAWALARLLREFHPVQHLQFAPMDPTAREYALLSEALRRCGLPTWGYFCFGNWFLRCEGIRWDDYLAGRSGELRNTLRRMGRRFAKAGGTLELIDGGEALEAGIAAYHRIYAASWKHTEPHPDFISALIRTCARMGWLRLGVASLDGRPVAAQLWIVAHGRAEIYKLAYDESSRHFSPGTLLTARLMQQALDVDAVHEVDYLTGDDSYKAGWTPCRRERWGLIAHNPRTLAGAVGALRELAGTVWRRLRSARAAIDSIPSEQVRP